ncbi:hypothetical protein AAC387_Pa09g1992 [Persea americana]
MGASEGIVSYSSLSKLGKESINYLYDEDYVDGAWDASEGKSSCAPGSRLVKHEYPYQLPHEPDNHDEEYDSSDDIPSRSNVIPEVNVKNVLSGIVAILTGRNKDPPEWLPDSSATVCMQCTAPFTPLTRGRHHCRFCGAIFCRNCTKGRCLLPVKFRERKPQRVCDTCYDRLDPLQGILINSISNAVQVAKHDVMDWTCTRGWLNMPVGLSMEDEIYKSTNTLRSYCQVARLNAEKSIPSAVLKGAKGLAILTVAKVGALLTYKMGTGLVVARRSDGSWSAPSAILSLGLGWGAQIGGELTDFIIVLHDFKAVKTFCSRMHFSLGAGLSAAAGPVGRALEADLRAGSGGSGMCYTYSCSKGAFLGISLESNFVATRMDTNLSFYGDPYLSTADILLGTVDRPKAAEPLYAALNDLYSELRC